MLVAEERQQRFERARIAQARQRGGRRRRQFDIGVSQQPDDAGTARRSPSRPSSAAIHGTNVAIGV